MAREGLMDDAGVDFDSYFDCTFCKHNKLIIEDGVAFSKCELDDFCEYEEMEE